MAKHLRLLVEMGSAVMVFAETSGCVHGEITTPLSRRLVLDWAKSEDVGFLQAGLEGIFTVSGDGSIDFASVVVLLKRMDYQGWLVVEAEQDPAKADPLTYVRMGYEHLQRPCTAQQL